MIEHNDSYRKEKYYFRIIDLSVPELETAKEILNKYKMETGAYKNTNKYTILLRLDVDSKKYTELINYISQHPEINGKYGIYISLVTENDSDGLTVPAYIIELLREIGGELDFSYTSV